MDAKSLLEKVAGQPEAGLMQGGEFSLAGGLLGGGAAPPTLLVLVK